MFNNHVYGIDLGSNMIKIYSQNSNEILKEKNMIAIRNKDTVLAVGDEAYEIYEKSFWWNDRLQMHWLLVSRSCGPKDR